MTPEPRTVRNVTYRPSPDGDERTIAAWLVRAVLAIPAGVDAGVAAALLGVTPRQVRAIRHRSTRR
jgi:hypothetical protein